MPRNDTALVNLNLWDIEFPVEFQPISFPHISGFELTFPFGFGVIIEAATARSYLQRWFPLPAPSVAALPLPGASSWLPILQSRFHVWTNALKGPAEAASRLTDGPTDWLFLSLDQSDPTQESSLSSIADLHKKTISKMEALSFTTTNSSLTGKWKYKMKLKSLEKLDAEPLPTLSRKFFVSCKLCLSPSSVTVIYFAAVAFFFFLPPIAGAAAAFSAACCAFSTFTTIFCSSIKKARMILMGRR